MEKGWNYSADSVSYARDKWRHGNCFSPNFDIV
jgi:hypothetical protein